MKITSLEITGGGSEYEVEIETNTGRAGIIESKPSKIFTIQFDDDFTFEDVKELVKTFNESIATLKRSGL